MFFELDPDKELTEDDCLGIGEVNSRGETLVAEGDDFFEKYIDWLEDIVYNARLLGLSPCSYEEICFVESLGIDITKYVWDAGSPGASGIIYKGWYGRDPSFAKNMAQEAFHEMVEETCIGEYDPYLDRTIHCLKYKGKKKMTDEFREMLKEGELDYYNKRKIKTSEGIITIYWEGL